MDSDKKRLTHSDSTNIKLTCRLLNPKGFKDEVIQVYLYSDRSIVEELRKNPWDKETKVYVGSIDLFRNNRYVMITLPDDKTMDVYNLIQSENIKDIIATGEPLKRKKATFTSVSFETNFIPEDWY